MLFSRFYDDDLAQASYLIGCQATGEAAVVDPRRDIEGYLDEAGKNGMRITAVTETHIHADYLSGARELAAAAGATLYLSDEGDADWKYGFEGEKLHDGDEIKIGNIAIRAVHTPGHTPEHVSFLVTDGATADAPGYILTGDFVFVGDLGRPDLLDEAAGGRDTRYIGAKQMFASLRDKFLALPDYVQVWPGHGSGSACGKALGPVPSSTVGYERTFSWWSRYVMENNEQAFVDTLLEGQPDAPVYFGRMKRQNKSGPELLGRRSALRRYEPEEMQEKLRAGEITFIDTRGLESYLKGAVPGALFVPGGKSFATWASWVVDPERENAPIVLLARDEADAEGLRDGLSHVGIDDVAGYVTSLAGVEKESVPTVAPEDLDEVEDSYVLDVRTKNDFATANVPGAHQLHGGRVMWHLDELPRDAAIVTHCQTGPRSAVVASMLRASGFEGVAELEGGFDGWEKTQRRQKTSV